jgi:hypothetical protein
MLPGVIRTPQDVLRNIVWTPRTGVSMSPAESGFRDSFHRWMEGGPGHLDHSIIRDLMSPEAWEAASTDHGFRARSFVQYITGQDSLGNPPVPIMVRYQRYVSSLLF